MIGFNFLSENNDVCFIVYKYFQQDDGVLHNN